MKFSDVQKYVENMSKYKHRCKCGHNVYLSKTHPKTICSWCKHMNYLDEKEEFKEKLKNALKK
jgi:NADH pyrophosphatase NudC (nudix superfamily)